MTLHTEACVAALGCAFEQAAFVACSTSPRATLVEASRAEQDGPREPKLSSTSIHPPMAQPNFLARTR